MSSYSQGRASRRFEFADDSPSPSSVIHGNPPLNSIPRDQNVRPPMAEVGMVNKKAQIQGTMMGIAAGLTAAVISRNLLRQSANAALITGLAIGTSFGYFSSRSSLQEGMVHLQEHQRIVKASKSDQQEDRMMNKFDLKAGQQLHHEGGVSGLYDYGDQSHSTRGDH